MSILTICSKLFNAKRIKEKKMPYDKRDIITRATEALVESGEFEDIKNASANQVDNSSITEEMINEAWARVIRES